MVEVDVQALAVDVVVEAGEGHAHPAGAHFFFVVHADDPAGGVEGYLVAAGQHATDLDLRACGQGGVQFESHTALADVVDVSRPPVALVACLSDP